MHFRDGLAFVIHDGLNRCSGPFIYIPSGTGLSAVSLYDHNDGILLKVRRDP
jgi:hypothetical protein